MGNFRIDGWGPDVQPGEVTYITVEDREAAVAAAAEAALSAEQAAASLSGSLKTVVIDTRGDLVLTKEDGTTVNAGNARGLPGGKGDPGNAGRDGSNVLPTDIAVRESVRATSPLVAVSTGSETRPALPFVIWVGGTVQPANMAEGDAWAPAGVVTVDTTPPSTPSNVVISGASTDRFTVSWTASTDNVGVTMYEIYVDGVARATSALPTVTLDALVAGTTYAIRVRARDAAGNWSPLSAAVNGSTVPAPGMDTSAPTVPTDVTITAAQSDRFTVSWTASTDNYGVTGYEVQVNGVAKATPAGTSVVITGLTPSTAYEVKVRARDAAGNWSALSGAASGSTTAPAATAHSVFGATAHPGTITRGDDGPVNLATRFRMSAAGYKLVGARFYKAPGLAVATTATMKVWVGGVAYDLSLTPERTAAMTGILDGWNEVRFATPLVLAAGAQFWVGVLNGSAAYLAVNASITPDEIVSPTLAALAEVVAWSDGGRSKYLYPGGATGWTEGHYLVDAIVEAV